MPKVSVLTPIYNTNTEYLKEMIESILNQSFKDFEFIILNDSPDNKELEKIIKTYNDSRIKYFENEKNLGISGSRNKLFELSQGEYIAILDHDDISLPTRLEKQVEILDKNKEIGVVSANAIIKSNNKATHHPCENHEIKRELAQGKCLVFHSCAMIRKSIMTDYNIVWENQYSPCEDYMLWVRLIDKTMFYNIKEPLLIYRDYEHNTTHSQNIKMNDKYMLISNILYNQYKLLSESNVWIILFGFIPFIKVQRTTEKTKYLLFGFIPLLKIVKK